MIIYRTAETKTDLQQILHLQQENSSSAISREEAVHEGFVTVQHTLALLTAMNDACPHVVAVSEGDVIGYALVMLKQFGNQIPVLIPFVERIDRCYLRNIEMGRLNYFIMGQICIDKNFRKKGVFKRLSHALREAMSKNYDVVVTEIAARNIRSLNAHRAVGFEVIDSYDAPNGESWVMVAWNLKN